MMETLECQRTQTANGQGADEDPLKIDRMLRIREVVNVVGLSRSSIYSHIRNGLFPKPLLIGARATAWRASDIRAWLDQRKPSDVT